jgi:hypothetical protein
MEDGVSRKFALASLIVGAALSVGGTLGFGVAVGVFVVYSVFNLYEKSKSIGDEASD